MFGNLQKNFANGSKTFFRWFKIIFQNFRKIFGDLRGSSEVFGNLRKRFKSVFRCFYDFLKFSENLRKSSENFRMWSEMFVMVRRSWKVPELVFKKSIKRTPSKLLRASSYGKVEWNTTRCILPIAYCRICNGNPGLWLAVFFQVMR